MKNVFINPDENRLRAGWRILFQTVIMIFFIIFFSGIGQLVTSQFSDGDASKFGTLYAGLAITTSIILASKYADRRSLKELGIGFDKVGMQEFLVGSAMAFIAQCAIFGIDLGAGFVSISGFAFNEFSILEVITNVGGFFLAMLAVGFYEELMSRGYHLRNISEGVYGGKITVPIALIIGTLLSSFIFGLLHAGNPNVTAIAIFNIVLAGVMLALPFLLTGRLWMSMGIHFSWNFSMAGIFGLPVSGVEAKSGLIHLEILDESILSGGNFGPEAGLVGVFGILVICVMVIAWYQKKQGQLEIHEELVVYK